MLIHYWCPYLTKIATISAVKRSAFYFKKFSNDKNLNVEIINSYGEWSHLKNRIENVRINNPLTYFEFFNKLPKKKKLSRITLTFIFISCLFPLLKKINKEKPDFIIIHLLTSLPLFLSVFFNKKTKIILRISGLPRLNFFRKLFWKIFSSKIYLITTPTLKTKEELVKKKIFNEKKIRLLRDPVIEVKKINLMKFEKYNYDFLEKDNYYLSIGRFTRQKNFKFLIESFSKILDKLKIKKLCIIGDGEEKEDLKKLIKKHNLQNNVHLLSYQNNPFKFINNCRAIISTSLYEDPGFVLIESCFLNKTIISSDSKNGPLEMSLKNNLGFFFNVNSYEEFERALLKSERELNKNVLINAKNYIKNFSVFSHYINLKKLLH